MKETTSLYDLIAASMVNGELPRVFLVGLLGRLNLCVAICKALDKTLDELFWDQDK